MPATPSPAQSETSRRNGVLSRGPVTPEGKDASARNAVRHGLCGAIESLAPEETAFFEHRLAALSAQHRPADAGETHWVERMAWVMVRERRLDAIEARVTAAALGEGGEEAAERLPSLATVLRYRARLERDWRQASGELAAARARREGQAAQQRLAALDAQLALDPQGMVAGMLAAEDGPGDGFGGCGTNEPEPAPSPGLNRAQRRRMEARLRQAKAA
ncbi:hypothetical protein SH611_19045 [Geminicoccaceae bacterium 1502E]|nr:hypothetical protein [Geminicoccaceae bacterium 1502E]